MTRVLRWVLTAITWLLLLVVPLIAGAVGFFGSALVTTSVAGLVIGALLLAPGGVGVADALLTTWRTR